MNDFDCLTTLYETIKKFIMLNMDRNTLLPKKLITFLDDESLWEIINAPVNILLKSQ